MKIEVSIGEIIDKYSILELKQQKIQEQNKLNEINKEKNELCECVEIINKNKFLYKLLMYVNEQIWIMTDKIKLMDVSNVMFAEISKNIFNFNQKRFRIKKNFNELCDSILKEQKSYSENVCIIIIENEDILVDKVPEINYLLIEYDYIQIQIQDKYIDRVKSIFNNTNIIFEENTKIKTVNIINLKNYSLPEEYLYEIFNFEPLTYIAGGLLGDFILSLSIICEKYYTTGRKGILYITDKLPDKFRFGLITAFNDTYELVSMQKYIKNYKIYNNENYEINLSEWRKCDLLFKSSWYDIYKKTYNIEWGLHKWLILPFDARWTDKICISTTPYRKSNTIDYKKLCENYKDYLIYCSQNKDYYEEFKKRGDYDLEYYCPKTFLELCIIINSCKLYCGNMSSPLTIAIASKKKFMLEYSNTKDDIHNKNFEKQLINNFDDIIFKQINDLIQINLLL